MILLDCAKTSPPAKANIWLSSLIVGLSALFYLYEFFIRVTPASITHQLMRDFNANATSIGIMSGCFFAAYAPMQIPVGLLCDRFGPKRLIIIAVLCCGIATVFFSKTDNIYIASIMRFVIGTASAFAFIGPLVLATHWFAERHLATIAGLIQALGCVGAMFAGEPITALIHHFNWRPVLFYSGLIGAVLALIFLLFLKDTPTADFQEKSHQSMHLLWQDLKNLFKKNHTVWISIVAFASWAPMSIFAELWGTSFLITSYHVTQLQAAAATAWIWLGVGVASPLAGWWSAKIQSRRMPLIVLNCIGLCSALILIFLHLNSWPIVDLILFLLGTAAGSQPITFGLACDYNPPKMHGTAMGLNNMAVISGGVLLQPLVGYLLTLFWDHHMQDGAPLYQLSDYQYALLLMPACYLIGLWAVIFRIKETHCQPVVAR